MKAWSEGWREGKFVGMKFRPTELQVKNHRGGIVKSFSGTYMSFSFPKSELSSNRGEYNCKEDGP